MKITFKTDEFKKKLGQVGSVIDKGAAMLAYKSVWVYAKDGSVLLTGVGLAASFSVRLKATVEGEFNALLPFAKIQDVIGNIKTADLSITLNDEGTVVTLRDAKRYKANIQTVQAEFPVIMQQPEKHTAVIGLPEFIGLIEKSEFAVPANDGRFTSTVARIESTGEVFRVVATDGFRLAIPSTAKNVGTFNLVLPKDALDLIRKMEGVPGTENNVTIYDGGDSGFMFTTETETLTVTKTSGEFPPYERILPAGFNTSLTIDAAVLLDSINLLKPLTDDDNPIVVFHVTEGATTLRLTAANASTGGDNAEDEVDLVAPVNGPALSFGLRHKLLTDFLTRTSGAINVQANDAQQVIDFYADNRAYRYLQMPQKVG